MKASLIITGDEVTDCRIQDTNREFLTRILLENGIKINQSRLIPDDKEIILDTLKELISKVDLVIFTGGLGVTPDDLTRETVAEFLHCGLVSDKETEERITNRLKKRKKRVTPLILGHARYPELSNPLANSEGLAVGFYFNFSVTGRAYFFPGVPGEMEAMTMTHLVPWLRSLKPQPIKQLEFSLFGLGESFIFAKMEKHFGKKCLSHFIPAIFFRDALAHVRLYPRHSWKKREEKEFAAKVFALFRDNILPREHRSIAGAIHAILLRRHLTLSVAESCTGGSVSRKIVENAGSSEYFKCGWVVYANESKVRELDVKEVTLEKYGAVSKECVVEMLHGALEISGTDLAIAVSGIAGPGGASETKPVGLVITGIGCGNRALVKGKNTTDLSRKYLTIIRENRFSGDRKAIINQSAQMALFMLLKYLEKNN